MNELSEVYMIETKSLKYILKIYSAMHTNPEEVSAEIELLNCLHEGGVSVSYPIKNNKGSDIIFFESQRGSAFGVLYSCAPGQVSYYMNEEQVRPLTSVEIEVFPYFGFAFWIYHIAFDYKHFADRSHPEYLQDQVSYIRKWTEWYLQDKV
jgi:hypothetical protein